MIFTRARLGPFPVVRAYFGFRPVPVSLIIDASALAALAAGALTGRLVSPGAAYPSALAGAAAGEQNGACAVPSAFAESVNGGIGAGQNADGMTDIFAPGEAVSGILTGSLTGGGTVTGEPQCGAAVSGSAAGSRGAAIEAGPPVFPGAEDGAVSGHAALPSGTDAPVLGTPRSAERSGARALASVEDAQYALSPGKYTYRNPNNGAKPSGAGDWLPCGVRWKKNGVTYEGDGIFWEGYPGRAVSGAKMYADRACTVQIGEYRQGTGYVLLTDGAEIELLSDPYFNFTHYWIWNIDFIPKT